MDESMILFIIIDGLSMGIPGFYGKTMGKPWENGDLYSNRWTGWWLGTMEFYDFPYIGKNNLN